MSPRCPAFVVAVLSTLVVCVAVRAEVDFRAPNKSKLTCDIVPDGASPRIRMELARGTEITVIAKGKKVNGGSAPAVTFDLLRGGATVVASGSPKGLGARLKRHVTVDSDEHVLRFTATGQDTGLFDAKIKWKPPRGGRFPVSITGAETAIPFSAEAGSIASMSLKPARNSAAVPEFVRVQTVNGSFVQSLANPGKKKGAAAGPATLPETADYVLVVRSSGGDGDATAKVRLRAPRARSFKTTTSDAVTGAADAGVTGTLYGAAVLPGSAPYVAPGGAAVALPSELGSRAQAVYLGDATGFAIITPDVAPIGPFVFCGPAGVNFSDRVRVTLNADLTAFGSDFSGVEVHKLSADGTVTMVPRASYDFDASANTVSFDADSFSVFGVFGPGSPPLPKFFSNDIAASDVFGNQIAMEGSTAVVTASRGNGQRGAAYVFAQQGGGWVQRQRLVVPDTAVGDQYGSAVDLDGDTVIIGALRHGEVGPSAGSAYVWVRDGATWTLEQELLPRDVDTGPNFGVDVAVSGDTAVVGAYKDDELGLDAGAAYVFTRTLGVWTLQRKLTASDGFTDHQFGFAVDIEGDTVVVGAPRDLGLQLRSGAYVFTRTGDVWSERTTLQGAAQVVGTGFGGAIALDNGTLAVSGTTDDQVGTNAGAVWVFTGAGASWTEQANLTPSDELEFGYFGTLGLEGDRLIVGARATSTGRAGAAYLFDRTNDVWSESTIYTPSDGFARQLFGSAVAVSGDALLIGASNDDEKGSGAGAVYSFTVDP